MSDESVELLADEHTWASTFSATSGKQGVELLKAIEGSICGKIYDAFLSVDGGYPDAPCWA